MSEIAEKLGISRKTVRRWCQRWLRGMEGLKNDPQEKAGDAGGAGAERKIGKNELIIGLIRIDDEILAEKPVFLLRK